MTELDRRRLIRSAAWAAPVVAVAAAAPLAAASGQRFHLVIDTPVVAVGALSRLNVEVAQGAFPLQDGALQLSYSRTAGTGVASGGEVSIGWSFSFPNHPDFSFDNNQSLNVSTSNFSISFSGPSTWQVTLTTPDGVYGGVIVVDTVG